MIRIAIFFLTCFLANESFSQPGSIEKPNEVFSRIIIAVKAYSLDTSVVPDDRITRKIRELRDLRGGFNIREAIAFKLAEDRQKNEMTPSDLDKLEAFFLHGEGKRWLDNATTWIYRRHFSHKELRQLVKFYKTKAGQKLATDFPVVMMQSLRAAEMIKDIFVQQQKRR